MNKPLISIIMPVKNGSNYLKEALEAIKLQDVDMEIIMVDDGSTDDSVQIAKNYGCEIVTHDVCRGLVASKNSALKVAKGQYTMFHDHDDVMNCNVLPQMIEALQEDQKTYAVMAKLHDFFSPELSDLDKQKVELRKEAYFGLFSGATLIKKEAFDIIGLFDESLKAGDIIDWSAKMKENNLEVKKIDLVSVNRRIHNTNFGRTNKEREYQDYAAILRSKLKRKLA